MAKYTKSELIDSTYQKLSNINKNIVNAVINKFLDQINIILTEEEEVDIEIRGFGVFKKRKRKDVNIINPKTKEKRLFKNLYNIRFKKSKELKLNKEVISNE